MASLPTGSRVQDLFRIESERLTVRWVALTARPSTTGSASTPPVELAPAGAGQVIYPEGKPPRLFEQSDYRFVVRSHAKGSRVEVRHRDPSLLRGLLPAEDTAPDLMVGTLNFRNQVGRSRFEVLVNGKHELTFEVEVFPSKIDYREDYEQILAEVQDLLTALAFDFLKATHTGAQVRNGPPTPLEWALRLRSVVDDLDRGLRQVERQPIRSLRRDTRTVRAERVRRPDTAVIRAARVGGGEGGWIPLAGGLKVRSRLPTRRAEPTLDTPEHRWLADHLARARRKLARIVAEEVARESRSARHAAAVVELRAMEGRLDTLLRLEPLQAATEPARVGFTSLRLLGAPGYREAARALIALQLGLRLEGNALELSLKDISTLYEYWCYLAVLDLVSQRTNAPINPKELVEVRATGLRVLLKKGRPVASHFPMADGRRVRVEYNPRYRYEPFALLTQQPDIVLAVEARGQPTVRVVLDAKYRVDASSENQERLGVVGPPADAINVLHRYRDAILTEEPSPDEARRVARSVVYAASLYPAAVSGAEFRRSALARQLDVVGVGAVPLLPSNRKILGSWLNELLGLDTWSLGQGAQPTAYDPWVWRAASEVVLVGVLRRAGRAKARQHLDWCLDSRSYYMPERPTRHARQSAVAFVALYLPSSLGRDGVGDVAWVGRVAQSHIVSRADLHTPWGGRSPTESVRVYTVERWERLQRPVPNVDGHRMSAPRWSTRLALLRAGRLAELALESPLEWSLVDSLRSAGIRFEVRAGEVYAVEEGVPRGRARIRVGGDTEVRYAGANGFEIRRGGEAIVLPTVPRVVELLAAE